MLPLVDQLIKNPRIGMLRDKAGAEKFEAHPLHFVDDRGIVEEPPAAEDHQVAELSGGNAQLMLVFAREHGDEELVGREIHGRAS